MIESWIKNYVSPELNVGDIVCLSTFMAHRSGNNISNRIRWSMYYRYKDANEKTFIQRAFPHPYTVYTPNNEILFDYFPSENDIGNFRR